MDGTNLDGKTIKVNEAQEKSPRGVADPAAVLGAVVAADAIAGSSGCAHPYSTDGRSFRLPSDGIILVGNVKTGFDLIPHSTLTRSTGFPDRRCPGRQSRVEWRSLEALFIGDPGQDKTRGDPGILSHLDIRLKTVPEKDAVFRAQPHDLESGLNHPRGRFRQSLPTFFRVTASMAAIIPAQSGISPPSTGQVRSGLVATKRAPNLMA